MELLNDNHVGQITRTLIADDIDFLHSNYKIVFKPSKQQLEQLASSPIKELFLTDTEQKSIHYKLSKKKGKQFMKFSEHLLKTEK